MQCNHVSHTMHSNTATHILIYKFMMCNVSYHIYLWGELVNIYVLWCIYIVKWIVSMQCEHIYLWSELVNICVLWCIYIAKWIVNIYVNMYIYEVKYQYLSYDIYMFMKWISEYICFMMYSSQSRIFEILRYCIWAQAMNSGKVVNRNSGSSMGGMKNNFLNSF